MVCVVTRRDDALQIAVIRSTFPRGYGNDLNLRAACDGPGGWSPDLNVRIPADGPGEGLLPGLAVWSRGANGAPQEEGRIRRNLEEPRHGVHALSLGRTLQNEESSLGGTMQNVAWWKDAKSLSYFFCVPLGA
jgi:hypothetical protein